MFNLYKLDKIFKAENQTGNNMSVICPNCGQVTLFIYKKAIRNQNNIKCSKCYISLKNKFLGLVLNKEIKLRKSLRRILNISILLSLISSFILIFYLFRNKNIHLYIYILITITLIIFIVSLVFLLTCQKQINKFNKLICEYDL